MSKTHLLAGVALSCVAACASHPQPTEHLASSIAAVRGAQEAGAERVPEAALHLKLAQEQIEQAKRMMEEGDNARADRMTIRAYNDAELANAIARASSAERKLAAVQGTSSGGESIMPPPSSSTNVRPGAASEPTLEMKSDD